MDGPAIFGSLLSRGYSPAQAAAIGGHILQESGGDPTNVNQREGAHGLLQWRLDRWDNLQKFAHDRGLSPTDPNAQLDFIQHEMSGPEAKAGAAFKAAGNDLPAASGALKQYIRFGDDSDATRLNNARGLLGMQPGMLSTSSAPQGAGAAPAAGVSSPAAVENNDSSSTLLAQLQAIPKMLAKQQADQVYAPAPVIPNNMAARLAAIAAAKQGQPT